MVEILEMVFDARLRASRRISHRCCATMHGVLLLQLLLLLPAYIEGTWRRCYATTVVVPLDLSRLPHIYVGRPASHR